MLTGRNNHQNKMRSVNLLGATITALVSMTATAQAQSVSDKQIVAELFTSQSCNSCVSANKIFRKIVEREDVVALAWHVDYWNMLQTTNGRWQDPYSAPENTQRQRQYNRNLRGRTSVYTPQLILNGQTEIIGSSGDKVADALQSASTEQFIPLEAVRSKNQIHISIGESNGGGNAYRVTFLPKATTKVLRGENAGKTFAEYNVVKSVEKLGVVRKVGQSLSIESPTDNEDCAIIVQEPGQGKILAAQYCP